MDNLFTKLKQAFFKFYTNPDNKVLLKIGTFLYLAFAIFGVLLNVHCLSFAGTVTLLMFIVCTMSEYRDSYYGKKFSIKAILTAMIPTFIGNIIVLLLFWIG
jgi:hypothetical protein